MIVLALLLALEVYDVGALAWRESRWQADAVSEHGACGLLQVRPPVLRGWLGRERWTCAELLHPVVGLVAGLHVRAYWRERAERAGKPGCWIAGWRGGNGPFRRCVRERP